MSEKRDQWEGEARGSRGGAALAIDAKTQLFQAVKAHIFELEIERDVASKRDLETLDPRIGAARLLLEWLSKALEPEPAASPTSEPSPPPGPQADSNQGPLRDPGES
jgi:hypothetical protein